MMRKYLVYLLAFAVALSIPGILYAQVIAKGSIGGVVLDPTGAVIPNAKVTVTSETGVRQGTSGPDGRFVFLALEPATYSVKVEAPGFQTAEAKNLLVRLNERANVTITLQPGTVTEVVEVTGASVGIDLSTTSGGGTVHSQLFENAPMARNIALIPYAVAGVADGGGTGVSNPSISGATGLENMYIVDGVNITNTGFGGVGTFSTVYGSLGQGVQFDFVKEVQVRTSGFEAQYGQALGGLVNMVTKSGTNDFHGGIYSYFSPDSLEATRNQPNTIVAAPLAGAVTTDYGVAGGDNARVRFFKGTALLGETQYDMGGDIGGPIMKDRMFFYGGFNWVHATSHLEGPSNFESGTLGEMNLPRYYLNYSAKFTANLTENANHVFEFSAFGDPSHNAYGPNHPPGRQGGGNLQSDFPQRAYSTLVYGGHNITARYNGVINPKWLVNFSYSYARNKFHESGFPDMFQVQDRTEATFGGVNPVGDGLPNAADSRGLNQLGGIGYWENTLGHNHQVNVSATNSFRGFGNHQVDYGFTYEKVGFSFNRRRSGPDWPVACTLYDGTDVTGERVDPADCGQPTHGASLRLRIGGPSGYRFQTIRGAFTGDIGDTRGNYQDAYLQDAWEINKYVTLKGGIRWERQFIAGELSDYTFAANWSPRLGIIVDPIGKRKTKLFYNWGRFFERMPNDLAVRALSNEKQYLSEFYTVTNPDSPDALWDPASNPTAGCAAGDTVADCLSNPANWLLDQAHFLSTGFLTGTDFTPFLPDVDMQYQDEWVLGAEHEFPFGIVVSLRYVDRKIRNIVEDVAGATPGMANSGFLQHFLFGNPSSSLDAFVNPTCGDPSVDPYTESAATQLGCVGSYYDNPAGYDTDGDGIADTAGFPGINDLFYNTGDGAPVIDASSPGEIGSDGVPDGFPDIIRRYKAYEFRVARRLANNWQMSFNYTYAKLRGNYEGLFRNDNGQSDPNLTSIFDFTGGPNSLLGDQFTPGWLPGDRRHIANFFGSYMFDFGLNLGTGYRIQTGVPIDVLQSHPIYLNQGEVPLGGRGAAGRTPRTYNLDFHADYAWKLSENYRLKFVADLFNITNTKKAFRVDNFSDTGFLSGVTPPIQVNPDFGLVGGQYNAFQQPFHARLAVRLEF
jgi:hypothetical protein